MCWCIRCNHAIIHSVTATKIGIDGHGSISYIDRARTNAILDPQKPSSALTAHKIKTPAMAHLGRWPFRSGFPFSPPPQPSNRSNRDRPMSLSSLQSEHASDASRQVMPVQQCTDSGSLSPSSDRSTACTVIEGARGVPSMTTGSCLDRRRRATNPVIYRRRRYVACNAAAPMHGAHPANWLRLICGAGCIGIVRTCLSNSLTRK
jgi:hypothetical protein